MRNRLTQIRAGHGSLYRGEVRIGEIDYSIWEVRETIDTTSHDGKGEIPVVHGSAVLSNGNPPAPGEYLLQLEEGDWLRIHVDQTGFLGIGDFYWEESAPRIRE